jgi:hypothetical protein
MFSAELEPDKPELFVVRSIERSPGETARLYFSRVSDARKQTDMVKDKALLKMMLNPLRAAKCRKVFVTPLGDIRNAGD